MANGESGLTLREIHPRNYPSPSVAPRSRAAVLAELKEAQLTGDVLATGEFAERLSDVRPQAYPARLVAEGKSREEVKAELREALRNGDVLASGEVGLPLNQVHPSQYAHRAVERADAPMASASSAMTTAN